MTRRQIVTLAVAVEAGLGVAAVVLAWMLKLPMDEWVRFTLHGLLWGIGGAAILLAILCLCRRFPVGPIGRLMRLVDHHVRPLFRHCTVVDLLIISILAGIGEELFFRGLLHAWIERYTAGWFGPDAAVWVALAATSVLFGVAHCISREYTVFATVLGVLLGGLALLTGDLLASIVAHAGYDFVALLLLTRPGRPDLASRSGSPTGSDSP